MAARSLRAAILFSLASAAAQQLMGAAELIDGEWQREARFKRENAPRIQLAC